MLRQSEILVDELQPCVPMNCYPQDVYNPLGIPSLKSRDCCPQAVGESNRGCTKSEGKGLQLQWFQSTRQLEP